VGVGARLRGVIAGIGKRLGASDDIRSMSRLGVR
jgi:hypothetical protein